MFVLPRQNIGPMLILEEHGFARRESVIDPHREVFPTAYGQNWVEWMGGSFRFAVRQLPYEPCLPGMTSAHEPFDSRDNTAEGGGWSHEVLRPPTGKSLSISGWTTISHQSCSPFPWTFSPCCRSRIRIILSNRVAGRFSMVEGRRMVRPKPSVPPLQVRFPKPPTSLEQCTPVQSTTMVGLVVSTPYLLSPPKYSWSGKPSWRKR